MSDNIIRPKQFRHINNHNPSLSKQISLSLYQTLFNLHQNSVMAGQTSQQLTVELTQYSKGMTEAQTVNLSRVMGSHSTLFSQMAGCMKEMMKLLVLESAKDLPHAILDDPSLGSMPDEHPPAA